MLGHLATTLSTRRECAYTSSWVYICLYRSLLLIRINAVFTPKLLQKQVLSICGSHRFHFSSSGHLAQSNAAVHNNREQWPQLQCCCSSQLWCGRKNRYKSVGSTLEVLDLPHLVSLYINASQKMHHSGVAVNCEGISFLECHRILFLDCLKLANVSKGKSAEFDFIQLLNAFVGHNLSI